MTTNGMFDSKKTSLFTSETFVSTTLLVFLARLSFHKSQITKQHKLTQPFLWVNNDYITLSHNCFGGTEWRTCVPVREVAFFCKDINTRNTNIYFGYHDQIEIDAIKHQEAEVLEEHCKNHKAKIGAEKLHEFKPAFSLSKYVIPSNWFKKSASLLRKKLSSIIANRFSKQNALIFLTMM